MTDAPAVPPAPSATVDGPADDTAPSTSPPPSLTGPELLALDPDAAAARWASLDDAALDAEVSAYRTALEGARAELVGLGRAVNLEDGQTGTIAGIEASGGRAGRGAESTLSRCIGAVFQTCPTSPSSIILSFSFSGRGGRRLPARLRRRPGPVGVAGE